MDDAVDESRRSCRVHGDGDGAIYEAELANRVILVIQGDSASSSS